MSTTLKLRGGSTAEHSTFTGEAREVTVDTQKNTVVIHDGTTAGGHPVANQADITSAKARANHTGTQPHTTITGLGTAATSNVTTSATDTTVGRLLKVGDFGLGSGVSINADLNDVRGNGLYYVSDSATNKPSTIGGMVVISGTVGASNLKSQLFFRRDNAQVFFRILDASSIWQPWREIYHQGSILGTVSQSSGTPTGAIIQRGSNANGEFVRYADGTQICFRTGSNIATNTNTHTIQGLTIYRVTIDWTYPVEFAVAPAICVDTSQNFADAFSTTNHQKATQSTTNVSIHFNSLTSFSSFGLISPKTVAIGRWF